MYHMMYPCMTPTCSVLSVPGENVLTEVQSESSYSVGPVPEDRVRTPGGPCSREVVSTSRVIRTLVRRNVLGVCTGKSFFLDRGVSLTCTRILSLFPEGVALSPGGSVSQ